MPGRVAGQFTYTPRGIILHATRSGQPYSQIEEFNVTLNFVRAGAGGLGWHATAGPDRIALHMSPQEWGWNARAHSRDYLAVEIAQGQLGGEISDATINAVAWWINECRKDWPEMPLTLVHHSELAAGIQDGKTDVCPRNTPEADEFRQRVLSRL